MHTMHTMQCIQCVHCNRVYVGIIVESVYSLYSVHSEVLGNSVNPCLQSSVLQHLYLRVNKPGPVATGYLVSQCCSSLEWPMLQIV